MDELPHKLKAKWMDCCVLNCGGLLSFALQHMLAAHYNVLWQCLAWLAQSGQSKQWEVDPVANSHHVVVPYEHMYTITFFWLSRQVFIDSSDCLYSKTK